MESSKVILLIDRLSTNVNSRDVLRNLNLEIKAGEQWALLGPSGSGKTMLAHVLVGRQAYRGTVAFHLGESSRIMLVEQQHHFKSRANVSNFYYQQRFNSQDAEDSLVVREYLEAHEVPVDDDSLELLERLGVAALLEKSLIQLSNGENKRLQLAIALSRHPAFLILDSPFTGLDKSGRLLLEEIIAGFIEEGVQVMLTATQHELPHWITHLAVLREGEIVYSGKREGYDAGRQPVVGKTGWFDSRRFRRLFPPQEQSWDYIIRMRQVSISYGSRIILNKVDWEVRQGERWVVSGPNGSGKSTLLSLVTGDNPQAYANEIYLFDRRRGSGESIWDIKKKIGYLSPELHLFFDPGCMARDIVGSGFFDTIGLFRQLSVEQDVLITAIIELLHLEHLQHKALFQLSIGEQRMFLLARALVKDPPLLILDEPCQGLDEEQGTAIRELVNMICQDRGTTLIYVSHYDRDIPACVDLFLTLGN